MRCLFLPFLPLFVAIFLVFADISFGSPANHNHRKEAIRSHNFPARPLDGPKLHAIETRAASDGSGRHLRRKRDMSTPSNNPLPALLQRHDHIMDHLRLHSSDSPLAKRSLASDLTFMGFKLIWDNADVIVSSTLAYYRTTEYYANMTILAGGEFEFGPTTQNFMITYGVFRLTFGIFAANVAGLAQEIAKGFPDGIGQFVRGFAETMLVLTAGVTIGTYRVLAWSLTVAVWITMIVVENADLPVMVTGPDS